MAKDAAWKASGSSVEELAPADARKNMRTLLQSDLGIMRELAVAQEGYDAVMGGRVVHAALDHALPLAHEGWEMYQPPLYYALEQGWFAARPSGTEDVYKLYAESFRGAGLVGAGGAGAEAAADAHVGDIADEQRFRGRAAELDGAERHAREAD